MRAERTELRSGAIVESERLPGVESVAFGIYFPTGSRDETPGTNGISHLIEHLMFKGTESRSADEINREIDLLGGGVNAFTTKETLCFHARVLGEHLPRVVSLLGDLAAHALPPGVEQEMERERSVILSEIASIEDSPEDLAGELCDQAYFGDHPLGLPVVGSAPVVARLGLPEIRKHRRTHLVARRAVVAAAGGVDHARLVDLVGEHLSDLPQGEPEPEQSPPRPGATACLLDRDLEQVHVWLSGTGVPRNDPRRHTVEIFSAIVGEGCSSRLFREVRERRGLVYTIYSAPVSYRDAGSFHVSFGVAPDRLEETLGVVLDVLADVRRSGVTPDELETAKAQLRTGIRLAHEAAGTRMAHLAEQALLDGEERTVESLLDGVERVTLGEVGSLARDILEAPLAVGAVGPVRDGVIPATGFEIPR
jgi:predicted Zn-dependent peptidase